MAVGINGKKEWAKLGEEKFYTASQRQLVWRKFRKHKAAITATGVLSVLYFLAIFCEFFSPYDPNESFSERVYVPPQRVHFFDPVKGFSFRPFVYGIKLKVDLEKFSRTYVADRNEKYHIYFFVQGDKHKLWNLFESDLHLFGTEAGSIFLVGTDHLGRDLLSRILYGSRISLSLGLVGILLTFVFGLTLGGIAGYLGGSVDEIVMRVVDLLISLPTIPIWMALAAALPRDWPIIKTYFAITIIFSIIGWTSLARVVRGKLIAVREEDFVLAAGLAGSSRWRVIIKHLLPSFASYIIVSLTLAIPSMILGETTLSFLGIGLQAPAISWGTLLQDAQKVTVVAHHPWILVPGLSVIIAILAFNFLGDGLRDAADPYR